MKTEQEIKDALWQIYQDDLKCPTTAHKEGRTCFDCGHAIRGTYRAVLKWVLDEADSPWPN